MFIVKYCGSLSVPLTDLEQFFCHAVASIFTFVKSLPLKKKSTVIAFRSLYRPVLMTARTLTDLFAHFSVK